MLAKLQTQTQTRHLQIIVDRCTGLMQLCYRRLQTTHVTHQVMRIAGGSTRDHV